MKKLMAFLTILAATLATSLTASPAQAVGSCPSGWICFWNTSSSSTAIDKRDSADTSPGECHSLPSAATSYVTNRSASRFLLYTNGTCTSWPAGTLYAYTDGSLGSPWNNNSRSYKRG